MSEVVMPEVAVAGAAEVVVVVVVVAGAEDISHAHTTANFGSRHGVSRTISQ